MKIVTEKDLVGSEHNFYRGCPSTSPGPGRAKSPNSSIKNILAHWAKNVYLRFNNQFAKICTFIFSARTRVTYKSSKSHCLMDFEQAKCIMADSYLSHTIIKSLVLSFDPHGRPQSRPVVITIFTQVVRPSVHPSVRPAQNFKIQ